MSLRRQSGITLVETAVAAAIVAIALGGAVAAMAMFGKYVAQTDSPARRASLLLAQQTLRVAQNAWKYGSPGAAPSGTQIATLPNASVTTSIAGSGTSAQITVTVRYTPDPAHADSGVVSISGQLTAKAPLPGSELDRPGLVPLPAGAP